MGKAELMQQKIAEQRKLPREKNEKLNNTTFINFIISIVLMVSLLAINMIFLKTDLNVFIPTVRCFSMVLIVADVILFEIGYRKDKISFWIHGFEVLACGILVLTIPYIYVYNFDHIKSILMLAPVFVAIYYVAKAIVIHVFETKKHQHNLSDVKEIVKDEEEGD